MDDIRIPLPDWGQHDLPIARAIGVPAWLIWTSGIIAFAVLAMAAIWCIGWWAKRRADRPPGAH